MRVGQMLSVLCFLQSDASAPRQRMFVFLACLIIMTYSLALLGSLYLSIRLLNDLVDRFMSAYG